MSRVPRPVMARLPLYLRQLEVYEAAGVTVIASHRLGADLGTTASQVRKDLAYFGQFGRPGLGYLVRELARHIRRIIGIDRKWRMALVGVGNLGRALCRYKGFADKGFGILAIFDKDPAKVGKRVAGMTISPMESFSRTVRKLRIELGILTVPAEEAQRVAEKMAKSGIKGILNFAPVSLSLPPETTLCAVDLALQLQQLSFRMKTER